MKALFKSRRFRQGSIATAITVVVVALVVVINFVATTLTERYSLTLDLTPSKVFSITDETKEYLSGIDKDVVIYILDTEESFTGRGEYYLQASEVLKKYALQSSHITLEFIDLAANPTFAQKYPTIQVNSTSILITCGDNVRDVTVYELYDIQSDMYGTSYQITASKAEQVLTSAILAVTSDKTVSVALLTGHNEEEVPQLTSLLGTNNYLTGEVNITTGDIDSTYNVAVLAAPERDFTEDELRRLDTFLKNGGEYGKTLLYFASITQTEVPNLDAFLADWGIAVEPGVVFETDSGRFIPGLPYLAVLDYAEEEYSQNTYAAGQLAMGYYARPMEQLFETKSSISTTVLLQFAATAGVQIGEEAREPNVAIPHVILSQDLTYSGSTPLKSQVVAFGSSAFLDSTLLSNPNFANSDYLLGLIATLTDREESIRIQSKDLAGSVMDITAFQALVLGAVLTIVLPLVVLISGLVIWARRRHR